jgi:hypothetical protein
LEAIKKAHSDTAESRVSYTLIQGKKALGNGSGARVDIVKASDEYSGFTACRRVWHTQRLSDYLRRTLILLEMNAPFAATP